MTSETANKFIEALHALESDGNLDEICSIFSDACEIANVAAHMHFRGREGAREFWSKYRANFGDVKSTFRNIIVSENRAALEWTTVGTSPSGEPFTYSGVTILEIDDGKVTRCQAYFDSEDLGRQMAKPKHKQATS